MEEIMKALEALKATVGEKNTQALCRIDEIQARAEAGEATATELRGQIETLERQHKESVEQMETLQRETRRRGIERDGVSDSRQGLEVLGALCRQELAGHLRQEIPARFREREETLLREYQENLQRDTLETGSTPGSRLVPTITESELIDAVEEVSDIMNRVTFYPGLPGNVDMPVLTGRPSLEHSRSTKDTDMTTAEPTFQLVQLRPEEQYVYCPVDNNLLLVSAIDLGRLMQGLLRDSVIDGLAGQVVAGSGPSAANDIMSAAAAYRYVMPAGKTAFGDIAYLDLVKAKAGVLKRGRARGVWLVAEDVAWMLGDMDRKGKTPALTTDNEGNLRILGKPVVIDESMPDLDDSAADTPFMAFGDPRAMVAGMVAGIGIAASEHAGFRRNQTHFRATIKSDVKRVPVKTLVTLRTATA